jgi:hypothetical protein
LISTKTGTRIGAGTDANVYITLFGSKGRTRRIYFKGNFESGDVDEIRTFARDVRPVSNIIIFDICFKKYNLNVRIVKYFSALVALYDTIDLFSYVR